MSSNSFFFATKVWLTSVVIAPLIFLSFFGSNGFAFYTPIVIVSGLVFSFPCWILSIFITGFINKGVQSMTKKKILIISSGIILTYGLFFLLFKLFDDELFSMYLATAYNLTIVFGVIFYKLHPDTTK